ncbi:MAG: four helix bundle protein [Anaerolineales bacterium]|nr:four helix bundle protein [Anaerolineales bacterium]
MAIFKRFDEMHAWQSARDLVKLVYDVTKQPDSNRDFALRDQIRRATISVMSNIAEGFGTGTDADFIRFLGYARRSVSEGQSQLYAALDQDSISSETFDEIYAKANITERQINALIGYLARSKLERTIKEETVLYALDLPDDLDLPDL